MSAAEFISSIAWPVVALIIALLFRKPLIEALASNQGALSVGPARVEWDRRAEEVKTDLDSQPLLAGGERGDADHLVEAADASPIGVVVDSFGQIEMALRAALDERGIEPPDRNWSVRRLASIAQEQGVISTETKDAIDGLTVMRNLAAHGRGEDISPDRAREFLALSQGVVFAIQMNSKRPPLGSSEASQRS